MQKLFRSVALTLVVAGSASVSALGPLSSPWCGSPSEGLAQAEEGRERVLVDGHGVRRVDEAPTGVERERRMGNSNR